MATTSTKKWYESRTIWLNVAGFIVVTLEYLGTIHLVDPEILTGVLGVLNVFLRFRTDEAVKL